MNNMKGNIFSTHDQGIFFTSDTHFGHNNILKYCNRPFESIAEMDETIITNWNMVVGKNDIVFHLGDFGFCGSQRLKEILEQLNGHIYLITGNHDRKMLKDGSMKMFENVANEMYVIIDEQRIYLNHKPYLCFDGTYGRRDGKWTWQLFGHVHSGPNSDTGLDHARLRMLFPTQYDVGVDNNNFMPISFDEVKQIITDQQLSQNLYRGTGNTNK